MTAASGRHATELAELAPYDVGDDRGPGLGSVDLYDLSLIIERQGGDALPYPFMLTRPTRFERAEDVSRYAAELPERLRSGDLSRFGKCLDALHHPDVMVSGHVQFMAAETPSIRVLAFRSGQAGYLMRQRADVDAIDVSALSPFELGSAVAGSMALVGPGRHPKVINGSSAPVTSVIDEDPDADLVIQHRVPTSDGVTLSVDQVVAHGKVQTTWRPARSWGIDTTKPWLIWARIVDDGDYVGAPDRSRGIPLTVASLASRIEESIADDLAARSESLGE